MARSSSAGGISPRNQIPSPVGSILVLGWNCVAVRVGETSQVRGGWC